MDDPSDRAPEPGDRPEASPDEHPDDRPAIRLDNVLKLAGIVETGGQAKRLIQAGEVKVNGQVETRRKHMLHEGDEVDVEGETFVVELTTEDDLEDDMDDAADIGSDGPIPGPASEPGT